MRGAIAAVALSLGALGGCTCFEPVGEADLHDAKVVHAADGSVSDAGASGADAGDFGDAARDPVDAATSPRWDAGDGGDPFCSGDEPRLLVGGQVLPLTSTGSVVFMNCCQAAEIVFHTTSALGDLSELTLTSWGATQFPAGEIALGMDPNQPIGATMTIGGSYFGSGMSAAGMRLEGTLAIAQQSPATAMDVRACLTLDAKGYAHDGVRFWAPAARVMGYDWQRRFALYLLADSTMTAAQAKAHGLQALALASEPLLDLYSIRYYRGGDHHLAFSLDMTWERLKNALGAIPLQGKPFVVVADGTRIYLGAFWTPISSMSPETPFVMMEAETGRGFTIEKEPAATTDVRADSRILDALRDSGKLAP